MRDTNLEGEHAACFSAADLAIAEARVDSLEAELAGLRSDLDGARNDFWQAGYVKGEVESMQRERAACAALCREAGCLCHAFAAMEDSEALPFFVFLGALDYGTQPPTVTCHDPRCPEALASRIEARGSVPRKEG